LGSEKIEQVQVPVKNPELKKFPARKTFGPKILQSENFSAKKNRPKILKRKSSGTKNFSAKKI
jgi:hypothetical protein